MAKNKNEPDSVYFLKILLYFVLGTIWIANSAGQRLLPAGLLLGLVFAHKDHFRIDRKIEYAILLVSTLISLFGPGIFLVL
jgi:hypothetical protein